MSKLGETVDRILKLLSEGEALTVDELQRKIPLSDTQILDLMSQGGLIELKKGEIRITEFGSGLITVK